jgi:hypothetical protein
MLRFTLLLTFLLGFTFLQAQPLSDTLGTVIFNTDMRFEKIKLVAKNNNDPKAAKKDIRGNYLPVLVNGYRLQVLTTTDRNVANQMKAKMYSLFPNEKAYILNKRPYYSVHQGDYFSLEAAQAAKKIVEKNLGVTIYVVNAQLLALPPEAAKTIKPKTVANK